MITETELCNMNHRSISTFYQVLELEKQMGAEREDALLRAMDAAYSRFTQELRLLCEANPCEE